MAAPERGRIETKVREVVANAIDSGDWTRYRLAQKSGVAYRVLARFLDEDRDIKLSTAAALLEALDFTICRTSRCRDK